MASRTNLMDRVAGSVAGFSLSLARCGLIGQEDIDIRTFPALRILNSTFVLADQVRWDSLSGCPDWVSQE